MRKNFLLLLAIVMIVPQVSFANRETENLEKVLQKVKERIEVPEVFTEFSYNQWGEDYHLVWQDQLGEEGSLTIGCEPDGDIISYNLNVYDTKESTLAKIDLETGMANAELFLSQVVPEYAKDLVLRETSGPSSDYYYTYIYDLYHNGVKVYDQVVHVNVSKETGEIKNFSGINFDQRTYNDSTPKLTQDQAQLSYLDQLDLPAIYKIYYEWEAKNKDNFLAYEINNNESKGIDAFTGKLIEAYRENEENHFKEGAVENEATSDTAKGEAKSELTPSERKALEETNELLRIEEIQQSVSTIFPKVKSAIVSRNNLYKNEEDYVRQLILKDESNQGNINLTVNAKTAEVESYYYWSDMPRDGIKYQWSEQEAVAFLSKVAPQAFKETKLIEDHNQAKDDPEKGSISYYYGRLTNGYLVEGDGLSVTYDRSLGEVTAYSKNWSQMDFKVPNGIISKEQALHNVGLELVYMETEKGVYTLAYTTKEKWMLIDAFTGKQVDYSGKVIEEEVQKFYTDLKGHPKEAIIKKLFDSGIYLKGAKLSPNTSISEEDFLNLLCQVTQGYDLAESRNKDEWVKAITGEVSSVMKQTLTREKAVYYMINTTTYKKVADVSELYIYPFKDQKYDESLKGHITLAYGLKLIQKDKTELFRPKDMLTRAEALEMIYYLMLSKEE